MNNSPPETEKLRFKLEDQEEGTIEYYNNNPYDKPPPSKLKKSFMASGKTGRDGNPFIWMYPNTKSKLSILNLQEITRYAMMATYTCAKGYLAIANNPLSKKDVALILGLPETTFRRFYDKLNYYGLVYTDDKERLVVNDSLFYKGKSSKSKRESKYVIKLYIDPYRDLYNSTPHKEHHLIGSIFKTLGHLNINFNVLCSDPLEPDPTKIEPMPIKEVCNIFDVPSANFNRFEKNIQILMLNIESQQVPVFKIKTTGRKKSIYINPALVFVGKDNYYSRQRYNELVVSSQDKQINKEI